MNLGLVLQCLGKEFRVGLPGFEEGVWGWFCRVWRGQFGAGPQGVGTLLQAQLLT